MKDTDYYRHYRELLATGQITFKEKKTLVDFVAKLVAVDYAAYVRTEKLASIWPGWTEELEQRELSEPLLVEMYVSAFLTEKMEEMDSFWYKVKTLFGKNRNGNKICFDAFYETEMYDFVLKRLSQGDVVHEVFPRGFSYVIEDKTLRRFT